MGRGLICVPSWNLSGSGKSTLMNIIDCLDRGNQGNFFPDGQDISKCSENEMSDIRLNKIGFVFLELSPAAENSLLSSNVEMPLNYAHSAEGATQARFCSTRRWGLQTVWISDPISSRWTDAARCHRLCAVSNNPRLLLADEPPVEWTVSLSDR